MNKQIQAVSALVLGFAASHAVAQCPSDLWKLSFSDEFNGNSLNLSTWSYETGRWPYNAELETYQLSAMTVQNGQLTINATRNTAFNPPYVSGRINTRTSFLQQYGRFEMRARLPKGKGMWPAFWLLPQSTWPPEIDIMEMLGHAPSTVYFTNHWGVYPGVSNQTQSYTGPDTSAGFHTYACEWYPGRIDFFFDGIRRASNLNVGVPDVPMYIILNLAVGGTWPGNPDATTVFPQQMVVDWVRAYSLVEPLSQVVNGSFENRGSSGTTPFVGWVRSGNTYVENYNQHQGGFCAKMYGNFTGGLNTSAVYQELLVTPGDTMAAIGWFYNWSGDRMAGANTVTMNIEWRSAANAVLGRETVLAADASSPTDYHMRQVVFGTAPAGAVKARLLFEFKQPAMAAGSIFFDDVSFGKVVCPVCPADYNQDGGVDGSDVGAFYADWESGDASADVNQDGGVDGADVQVFFTAWERGSC
jgi:beta-glucanase (GH16 family)